MDIKIILNFPRGNQIILIDFLLLPNLKKNKCVFCSKTIEYCKKINFVTYFLYYFEIFIFLFSGF